MTADAPPGATIDKRTFLAALQCLTQGWFALRKPREAPSPGLEWLFYCGNEVGAAARAQLGLGRMLPWAPIEAGARATQHALADDASTLLFEATFVDGPLVARADAIRRHGNGWDLLEIKSAKEPENGKIKDEQLDDLAYTVMVAQAAGLPLRRCSLMLLSRRYRLGSAEPCMVEVDLTDVALARADELARRAGRIVAAITGADRPAATLMLYCRQCEWFASQCLGQDVGAHIFMLPALSQKRFDTITPIVDLHHVPDLVELTDNQRRVFEVIRSGAPRATAELRRLDEVAWPAYYLDFETVMPALPWFAGDAAHTQHPFQYSIHICERLGDCSAHVEYLAPREGDWRRELAERLLDDLGTTGSIVVYTDFEAGVLRGLAAAFPDLAPRLNAVIARLFDLHDVIKRGYCHPDFQGRTSIKKVLPVMVPELTYEAMKVPEGASASGVFGLMRVGRYDADESEQWRNHLLEYCKLDTLAMVRVHQALAQVRAALA